MGDDGRVITAKVPTDLAIRLDEVAGRIDRTRSWIIKQALADWLDEEDRRYEMTLEGSADFDAGRIFTHEEILKMAEEMKRERREKREAR